MWDQEQKIHLHVLTVPGERSEGRLRGPSVGMTGIQTQAVTWTPPSLSARVIT